MPPVPRKISRRKVTVTHLDSLEVAGDLLSLGCLFSSPFEASEPRRDQNPFTVGEERAIPAPCPILPLLLLLLRFMGRGERGVEGPAGCMGSPGGLGVTGPLPASPPPPPPSPSSLLKFGESLTEELDPRPESLHATLEEEEEEEEEEEGGKKGNF